MVAGAIIVEVEDILGATKLRDSGIYQKGGNKKPRPSRMTFIILTLVPEPRNILMAPKITHWLPNTGTRRAP